MPYKKGKVMEYKNKTKKKKKAKKPMKKQMKAAWFKKCKTQEDKDKIKQKIMSNSESLLLLEEILESMLEDRPTTADYDSPSWSHKMADRIGYNRALTQVLDLINLNKE